MNQRPQELQLALSGEIAVATGFGPCTGDVFVSRTGGRSWQEERLPRGLFCADPAIDPPQTILLACSTALLMSRDGGQTWTREVTAKTELGSLSVGGNGQIWAAGQRYGQVGSALWRSEDGRNWVESWPLLRRAESRSTG